MRSQLFLMLSCTVFPETQGWSVARVVEHIDDGGRLARPVNCPVVVWQQLILACWAKLSNDRPNFSDLYTKYKVGR